MKLIYFKILMLVNIEIIWSKEKYRDQFKADCGQPKPIGRIIGGKEAGLGEFPWMARIGVRASFKPIPIFFCGGSLITDQHILTAKHCLYQFVKQKKISRLVVSLGDHNDRGQKACVANYCTDRPVIYTVAQIFLYSLDESTFKNDIAILRLSTTVEFTRWISPVCLPDNIASTTLYGQRAIVIGFGVVDSQKQTMANVLQKIKIAILSNEDCYTFAEQPGPGQMCVGSATKDSCVGDSGGPLFKLIMGDEGPRYMQLGIVSYGSKNCEDEHPAVYTDVNYYLDWIDYYLDN